MMSLLGSEINLKGYVFRPFYLIFGLLSLSTLLIFLGLVYVILYVKNTLVNTLNNIKKDYKRNKNIGLKGV